MPNTPMLDASVQWKINSGAIRFREAAYRAIVEDILSSGLATEVVGMISAGKEADVYLARLGGAPLVVKAYRLYRTVHRGGRPVKINEMAGRAASEFDLLRQAWQGGAPVPTPARRMENLVSMRYLGSNEGPAPRLVDLQPREPTMFLGELLAALGKLLEAGVIHGDLSAYNILIHEDRPWFIDLSDGFRVDRIGASPWRSLALARDLLTRDLEGLRSYFRRLDVPVEVESLVDDAVGKIEARWRLTHGQRRPPTPGGRGDESPDPP